MKIEKDTLFAIIICAVVLFGWEPFCRYMGWGSAPATAVQTTQSTPAVQPEKPQTVAVSPKAPVAPVAPQTTIIDKPVKISNDLVSYEISPADGAVKKIELAKYANNLKNGHLSLDMNKRDSKSGAMALSALNDQWRTESVVSVKAEGSKCEITRQMANNAGQKFLLTQTWELAKDAYTVSYSFTVNNISGKEMKFQPAVSTGDLASWSVASGDPAETGNVVHTLSFMTSGGEYDDLDADTKDSKFFVNIPSIDWTAVANKYFCVVLNPEDICGIAPQRGWLDSGKDKSVPVISGSAVLPVMQIPAGAVAGKNFKFYSGPKISGLLSDFQKGADEIVDLSWGPLDYLAEFLLWCLAKLHELIGNYGVSIVILTLIVRTIFYPVTAKANASMRKMQTVQPKLKELKEKYKDNPQLMNVKMMELYRAEGVNPMGGCLPMLFQIPVFIALYHALNGAVELRQAAFLWCKDLAQPDTIATLNLGIFTLDINPLAIAMTLLMVIQQRITPMSGDPMQKRMMYLMPVIMLFFLYNLPSGLTLYWTVSNCFSIVQMLLQRRSNKTAGNVAAAK